MVSDSELVELMIVNVLFIMIFIKVVWRTVKQWTFQYCICDKKTEGFKTVQVFAYWSIQFVLFLLYPVYT